MPPASGSAATGPLAAALAATAAALVALAASGPVRAATTTADRGRQILRTAVLQTSYPASWHLRLDHLRIAGQHVAEYSLSSTTPLNADAIPPAGGIGITVYVYPERIVGSALRLLSSNPTVAAGELIGVVGVVGIPRPAQYVTTLSPLRPARLGGRGAARVTYLYEYADDYNLNLQDDVVALHGHSIVQVELDTAPALRAAGESAFAALLRAWHWRGAARAR